MAKIQAQYDDNVKYISKVKTYSDETGTQELIETSVYKKVYGGKHFWKVWLGDLLYTLGLINNSKQLDVVFYVMHNTEPANNLFIGTYRHVAEKTGISYKTVATIFKKMIEVDLIAKKQNGVYKVKPSLLMKGDEPKKNRLIIEYEELKQEQAKVTAADE